MKKTIQRGYILLADISGFDAYITKVELRHAKGVVKELLELIVNNLIPPMILAGLQGDAVLAFTDDERIQQGETLVELIESTYIEFRGRLESIKRNNSCDCQACRDAPTLDLKFFLHHGEYISQSGEGEGVELGGLDVKLIRERLLKDQVTSTNGTEAYVLFTAHSLERLGIDPQGLITNQSSYPNWGVIKTARLDLQPRYQELIKDRRVIISVDTADFSLVHDFNVPPYILWNWLHDPQKRSSWMKWRTWSAGIRPWGRNGVGALNHCAHGLGTLIETILDWRPYKYFTVESRQDSIGFSILQSVQLVPLSNETRTRLLLHARFQKAGPLWLIRQLLNKVLASLWRNDYERLDQMIEEGAVSIDK